MKPPLRPWGYPVPTRLRPKPAFVAKPKPPIVRKPCGFCGRVRAWIGLGQRR